MAVDSTASKKILAHHSPHSNLVCFAFWPGSRQGEPERV